MALDPALMDKFERDWNEALEVYEARTTAARLGDTSVDPFRRATLDPKVAAGMQSELFGPLSAKWGLLTEGAGRRSAAAPASAPTPPRYFQTRAGVFSLDPFTGESQKVIDVPPNAPSASTRAPQISAGDRAALSSLGRMFGEVSMTAADPKASAVVKERSALQRDAIAEQMALIESKYKPAATNVPAAAPQQWQVDPETIPFGNPGNPSMFMGDPMNPRIQDPPPSPLPVGPSAKRGLRVLEILREGN